MLVKDAKAYQINFGKHKGTHISNLLLTQYNYCKWLLNQPKSNNKGFEKARTCLNVLLEDDEFVSELADHIPNMKPNHSYAVPSAMFKKPKPIVVPEIEFPDPKPLMHYKAREGDGIDMLLASRIDVVNDFKFNHPKDAQLAKNFMNKFEVDGEDTLLMLQRSNGILTLLNYKMIETIIEEKGVCEFNG
jgi:hypothetical protein